MSNKTKKYKKYSISKILRDQKKSNEYFEMMLTNISLEDLIALRLEVAFRNSGILYYNFPLWRCLEFIIQESVLKYAVSATETVTEAIDLLGVNPKTYQDIIRKYDLDNYFLQEEKKDESSDN